MGLDIRWVGGRGDAPLYHHYAPQESHFKFCLVSSFVEIYVLTPLSVCSPKEKKEGRSAGDDEDEPRKLSQYSRINPAFEYQN